METYIVRPDSKGRISLGKIAQDISSYRITCMEDGKVVLEPYVEIPAQEKWLFNNKSAMKQLLKGLDDSAKDEVSDLGSFAKYTKE